MKGTSRSREKIQAKIDAEKWSRDGAPFLAYTMKKSEERGKVEKED